MQHRHIRRIIIEITLLNSLLIICVLYELNIQPKLLFVNRNFEKSKNFRTRKMVRKLTI